MYFIKTSEKLKSRLKNYIDRKAPSLKSKMALNQIFYLFKYRIGPTEAAAVFKKIP